MRSRCARGFPSWRLPGSSRSGWTRMAAASWKGSIPAESYAVLERHAPGAIRRYRSETELRFLVGTGVSAAAIWRMREALDAAGYRGARIVASSGFGVDKCRVMADAKAPIDVVGTGSFIPEPGTRPTRPRTSSSTTACRWSRSAASSCCAGMARAKSHGG